MPVQASTNFVEIKRAWELDGESVDARLNLLETKCCDNAFLPLGTTRTEALLS